MGSVACPASSARMKSVFVPLSSALFMYVVKITARFLSVVACRTALLMTAFFASLPPVCLACSVRENCTRRRSKTEFPSPNRPISQLRPSTSAMRSSRLSVAALDGPAAMTISLFERFRAHEPMTAEDSCFLPVPGGPRISTSLCPPVRVIA